MTLEYIQCTHICLILCVMSTLKLTTVATDLTAKQHFSTTVPLDCYYILSYINDMESNSNALYNLKKKYRR